MFLSMHLLVASPHSICFGHTNSQVFVKNIPYCRINVLINSQVYNKEELIPLKMNQHTRIFSGTVFEQTPLLQPYSLLTKKISSTGGFPSLPKFPAPHIYGHAETQIQRPSYVRSILETLYSLQVGFTILKQFSIQLPSLLRK